jgi:predicted metal-dependent phosphoesterase TrpH
MQSIPPFNLPGQWYRGNLHTHTTNSDGRFSPEENVAWHTQHGYDFLTITDHNRVTLFEQDGPCLIIPGVEISTRKQETGVEYHVVTIGVRQMPIPHLGDPQETIDAVNCWRAVLYRPSLLARSYFG